jgi:hypothetical protein
MPIEQFIIDK